jgi:hypothetical protein
MLPGLDGLTAKLSSRTSPSSEIAIPAVLISTFVQRESVAYTTRDDLSKISLGKFAAVGSIPCAVVEISAGNFQA